MFLLCAVIGWAWETLHTLLTKQEFSTHGYWFVLKPLATYFPRLQSIPWLGKIPLMFGLPMIEIYGFGAIIVVYGFQDLRKHPVALFFTGVVLLTLFELLGSYFCTYVLGEMPWDYSDKFLNFQGRICLSSSIAWGVGSVLGMYVISPLGKKLYHKLKGRLWFKNAVWVLIACAFVCALAKYWWYPDLLEE